MTKIPNAKVQKRNWRQEDRSCTKRCIALFSGTKQVLLTSTALTMLFIDSLRRGVETIFKVLRSS